MTTQAVLDPRAARPLTSHEISKVLCGIIGGVATFSPDTTHEMPLVVEALRRNGTIENANALASKRFTWAAALGATVWSLRGWCDPADVETALAWIAQHIHLIVPVPTIRPAN